MKYHELEIPGFFDRKKTDKIWRVDYQKKISKEAIEWKKKHSVKPAESGGKKVCLLVIDAQNTFCIPEFELYVTGAQEDNARLSEFIYRNLNVITMICPTMDTHTAMQIFHPVFLVDGSGNNPSPATMISLEDVKAGKWKINPDIADSITGMDYKTLQKHLIHYVENLNSSGKYQLITWPYHAMLGGIGHALVSSVEEAIFFHTIARSSQACFEIKGGNPLTENYSVLRAEVVDDTGGNTKLIEKLLSFDYIIIAGQAKSHCVAWTIEYFLNEIKNRNPLLAKKVYLLEDCTSPVIIPGVIDFTDLGNKAFERFASSGMNVVKSLTPIKEWPGISL